MHNTKKQPGLPVIMVIISAVLWGTYGSFVTAITALGIGRNAQIFLRFLMTTVPVGILIAATGRQQFQIRKKDFWLFPANAIFSLYFFSACYTGAIAETKIATAAALLYTAPVIVMVLSAILFHESVTKMKVFCILLSVLGCALASGIAGEILSGSAAGDGDISVYGILLGLGAGLGYALYSIFSRIVLSRGYSVFTNVFYSFSIVTLLFLGSAVRDGSIRDIAAHPQGTLLAVICGLVTGFGAYVLYTLGMEQMETSRAAQLATIEPVTAALLGSLLFHQPLSLFEGIGVALVVLSVILMNV